jgi:hypothetical protein
MQFIFNSEIFANFFLYEKHKSSDNVLVGMIVLDEVTSLCTLYHSRVQNNIDARHIINNIFKYTNSNLFTNEQQDAGEFLQALFQLINKDTDELDKICKIRFKDMLQCLSCGNINSSRIMYYNLYSITIDEDIKEDQLSLELLIRLTQEGALRESTQCSNCNKYKILQTFEYEYSNVVIFYIIRSIYRSDQILKNEKPVTIPKYLILNKIKYILTCCIYHIGQTHNGGHYIAQCFKNDKSIIFSDTHIRETSIDNIDIKNIVLVLYEKH